MIFTRREAVGTTIGRARVDRRTKNLTKRLQAGDIAVIDHEDIDRIAAEALIKAKVGGIVNASASISGRYPNVGPLLIAAAGIPLLDNAGSDLLSQITDGQTVQILGNEVVANGAAVGKGTRQDLESLEIAYESAKLSVGAELERFAENTLEYMRKERHLLFEAPKLPPLKCAIKGRHVLIVVRGHDYRDDLAQMRSYIRDVHPVLIGVDGGADALLEDGFKPDIIIGDFDSVSTAALRCGAELVVHTYADGMAPGAARLEELGLHYEKFGAGGTSEDIAMILAYDSGAELIVALGTHASMVEFLDKGRKGMASTFLVRLKVGPILVDAKGVNRLYRTPVRKGDLAVFLSAALAALLMMLAVSYPLRSFLGGGWFILKEAWDSLVNAR